MAIDVDKLIEDTKKKQAEAKKNAATARSEAEKDKTSAKAAAESKVKSDYADTLRPRLKYYEDSLKIYANKIARGDKLATGEQKEFDRLVKEYKSVSAAIDKAVKDSYDIVVKARKVAADKASAEFKAKGVATGPTGTTNAATDKATADKAAKDKAAADKAAADKAAKDKAAADKAAADETPDKTPVVDREAEALNKAAALTDFAIPETLFKNIPSLQALLKKYINTPGMTSDAFLKELRNDLWYKQNSKEIKERYVQYYNYRDLQASGRAQGTTDYEMQIDKIEASLKKRAITLGSAAASDPAALRKAAENLYITNRSEDESFITDFLAASIRPVAGIIGGKGTEGYSGKALENYQTLLKTARDNGLKISDIIPGGSNEQQLLQNIASGKIDIDRITQDTRKLAAQGQPQYVRDLLSQGFDLKQVFAPYRNTMASILEIDDAESIDLNDPVLRSAISDKGDMNIYDFKKLLRRDGRWQYTEQARQDVSSAALDILRDFGFQG